MKIEEAIKHAEEVAKEKENIIKETYATFHEDRPLFEEEENECKKCAEEHRQLAEWLKELKQLREQKHCEDAISRQAMLDYQEYLHGKMSNEENYELWKFIKALPSVVPERKKAKWKEYPHEWGDNWQYSDYECSICHNRTHFDTDFCPNCGAEMEREE